MPVSRPKLHAVVAEQVARIPSRAAGAAPSRADRNVVAHQRQAHTAPGSRVLEMTNGVLVDDVLVYDELFVSARYGYGELV